MLQGTLSLLSLRDFYCFVRIRIQSGLQNLKFLSISFVAFQARCHGSHRTGAMALPVTVTSKCWAYCLPFNFFLCIPGTILWDSLYLSHGFASHRHCQMLGLLCAFQFLSLHSRHNTIGVTVLEPWLRLSLSRRNAWPIVCLSISVFAFQARYYGSHRT